MSETEETPVRPDPDEESTSTRRAVLGLACAAVVGVPVLRWTQGEDPTTLIVDADDLPPIGQARRFKIGRRPVLLIRHGESDFVCLDALCTHMRCKVRYQPKKDRIFCICHGGVYDPRTGDRVEGPPPKPLPRHRISFKDGDLVIDLAPNDQAKA